MDGVADIMNNPDSTNDQVEAAIDQMLGNPDKGIEGTLVPGLTFLNDLYDIQ